MASNTKEDVRMMYNPASGGVGPVPYSKIAEAVQDGLEFTTHAVNPKTGGQGWVANSKMDEAIRDGLKPSGVPYPVSPYEKQRDEQNRIIADAQKTFGTKTADFIEENFFSGGGGDLRNTGNALMGVPFAPVAAAGAVLKGASYLPKIISTGAEAASTAAPVVYSAGRMLLEGAKKGLNGAKFLWNNAGKIGSTAVGADVMLNDGQVTKGVITKVMPQQQR